MVEACQGFNGLRCGNAANYCRGFCDECYEKIKQRRAQGFCIYYAGRCKNKRIRGNSWCEECYEKFHELSRMLGRTKFRFDSHTKKCDHVDTECLMCAFHYHNMISTIEYLQSVQV